VAVSLLSSDSPGKPWQAKYGVDERFAFVAQGGAARCVVFLNSVKNPEGLES
jgi:hypothetical protein